jgi:uncharacterized protein YdeI (YjbR/CyaY-like superfamily)
MAKPDKLPTLAFASAALFEAWLDEHHAGSLGIWIKIAKKDSGVRSIDYAAALEVALAFGWIDGQKRALDAKHWLQRFTPRGKRSSWSKINCDKATALIRAKKMRPAGMNEVALAKKDGRWDAAYPSQKRAEVPDDLLRALAGNKKAAAFFAGLDSANRYAILYRLHHTKKAEARAAKIEKFVAMLSVGKKIHEPR